MHPLYQRLKELDSDTFQRLCFHLLKDQHPGLEISHVEGASGDEGLDVFAGELFLKPAIWQCKSFPNGVGKSQKAQIKKSLQTALKHFTPSCWILCLSIGLDAKAHRWFERLKKSYESKVKIELLSNAEIVHELMHRRSLRNQFFQGAVFDLAELKRIVSESGKLTLEELERATDASLEDIVERWKERDARFNYQIVFDGDLGPPKSLLGPPPPGLVMSRWQDGKTVNVFARDAASLRTNPPQFSTTFKGSGIKKYEAFIRTGVTQEFEADEVEPIRSDWALMSDLAHIHDTYKLRVAPSPLLTNIKRSVRLEFVGNPGTGAVRYEVMELRPVRAGTEELEFSLSGRNIPFKLSIVASIPLGNADIRVIFDSEQRNPKIIKKALDALNLLRPSGKLLIFDLETEKPVLDSISSLPEETQQQGDRRSFINDVVAIGDRFGIDLKLPNKMTKDDVETIYLLREYMRNGTVELDNVSFVLTKSDENRDLVLQQFATGKMSFKFVNLNHEPLPKLFGTVINTGPVVMEADVDINDLSATLRAFREAPVGAGVRISTKPFAPVRVSLCSDET